MSTDLEKIARETGTIAEVRAWLTDYIQKRNQESLSRRGYAETMRNATPEELRESQKLAEKMAGRKLPKASVKSARLSADCDDRIADKIEAEIIKLEDFVSAIDRVEAELSQLRAKLPNCRYICSHCGVNSKAEPELWLDSGTTLTCSECGKATIVDLDTPEDRTKRYAELRAGQKWVSE